MYEPLICIIYVMHDALLYLYNLIMPVSGNRDYNNPYYSDREGVSCGS